MASILAKNSKGTETKKKRVRTVEGSCWECKQGRVKCSLGKPICKRCARLQLGCDYSKVRLKWAKNDTLAGSSLPLSNEVNTNTQFYSVIPSPEASRNTEKPINFGNKLFTTTIEHPNENNDSGDLIPTPIEESPGSIHTMSSDLELQKISDTMSQIEGEINTPMWSQNQYTIPESQLPVSSFNDLLIQPTNLPSFNQQLTYFKNIFLPKFHVFGNIFNLDWNQVVEDPLTNQLVVTLSTFDMFHNISNSTYIDPEDMTKERSLAIRSFSRYLRDNQTSSLQSMFNSCVMLCILDGMVEPQVDSKVITSTNHLFGARAIMRRILENDDTYNSFYAANNPLYSRMLSIFNTMDLTYSILSIKKPFFSYNYWLTFAGMDCWFGTLNIGDPFLDILCKLSRLAELGFEKSSAMGILSVDSIQELNQIHLNLMDYNLLDYTSCSLWNRFISAFAQVALLYYYRVLNDLPVDNEYVQKVTISFVSNVSLGMTNMLEHCLLFPLLVVGAHVRNKTHQIMIKNYIVNTYNYLNFSNTKLLLECLEISWSTTDKEIHELSWVQQFEKVSRTSFVF